jgi:3-deoxy-D-manno-octulosonic-acid transferase
MSATFSFWPLLGRTGVPVAGEGDADQNQNRPDGPIVWLQCGEASDLGAARALAARLAALEPQLTCLVTIPGQAKPERDGALVLCPAPEAGRGAARAFVEFWRPDVFVCLTGQPDTTLVTELETVARRLILANATAATAATAKRGWLPRLSRSVFDHFDYVLASDKTAADALQRDAGLRNGGLISVGPLQDGARVLPHNERERQDIAALMRTRPVWCAASATMDEIDTIAAAHRQASRRSHRLLLVVLPRKLEDASDIADALRARGFAVGLRSDGAEPTESTQAYVADLGGEAGLWYRVSPVTFLCGSLNDAACDDPFEPAALGSATIHGPRTSPYQPHFSRLDAAGGSVAIATGDDLGSAVEMLIAPDRAASVSHAAWDVTSTGSEATERVVELICDAIGRAED